MSRRRSSSMCCSRLMAPKLRPSFSVSGSTARLGIEVPWDVLDTVAQAAQSSANGIGVLGGRHDLTGLSADGLSVLLQFEFIDLIMNLALKFIAGALDDRVGHQALVLADDRIVEAAADQALDGVQCIGRVGHRLTLGGLADQP